jgi:superfamily I DNA and/or RNA helicase
MSQYNDQCASIRDSLTEAGYKDVNVNTVVASQG